MSETVYWISLAQIPGLQGQKGWGLINHFGSAKAVWEASADELKYAQILGPKAIDSFIRYRANIDPVKQMDNWEKAGIKWVTYNDAGYPNLLKCIFDPPLVLFVLGEIHPEDDHAIAIIGARRSSTYGRTAAEKFAGDLAEAGVTVVSGLARVIDTAAHRGALAHNGRTIAVLGCGVDVVYPRENKQYYESIPQNGAIISEFPPGVEAAAWHFPLRNRIISGLSRGVLVVEAAEKSGTLITVDCALEQGRDVFAVPGNIFSPLSAGTNRLLRQGAAVVRCGDDILEELGIYKCKTEKTNVAIEAEKLSSPERKIITQLSEEPVYFEDLINKLGLQSNELLSAMMMLELKGLVCQLPGQRYVRAYGEK